MVSKLEAGYNLKECFAIISAVTERAFNTRLRPFARSDDYAMLMSPNKGKASVHGCHCPNDVALSMPEVMARLWVGVGVSLALDYDRSRLRLLTSSSPQFSSGIIEQAKRERT